MANLGPVELYQLVHAETLKNNGTARVWDEIIIVSIILAESGGNPAAVNTANNTPVGSRDRGLYQFNDHWNPDVTDAIAFDPVAATHAAYVKSGGWKKLDPLWTNSKGRKDSNIQKVAGALADVDAVPVGDVTDWAEDKARQLADAVTPDWAQGLAKLLANLVNPTWWKRIGIGALGVIILVIALIIVFGKDVAEEVKPI